MFGALSPAIMACRMPRGNSDQLRQANVRHHNSILSFSRDNGEKGEKKITESSIE
jgi:hypothetical protein